MHEILRQTHKESNINIMKARDYYFDVARKIHNDWKNNIVKLPVFISVVGMSLVMLSRSFSPRSAIYAAGSLIDNYLEMAVGITAIISFVINCILSARISDNLDISNELRDLYDCNVLGIPRNRFFFHSDERELKEYTDKSRRVKDRDKYEVWYRETFGENDFANMICMAMDNVIYTYHIYRASRRDTTASLALYAAGFLFYSLQYHLGGPLFILRPFHLLGMLAAVAVYTWYVNYENPKLTFRSLLNFMPIIAVLVVLHFVRNDFFVLKLIHPLILFAALFDDVKERLGYFDISTAQERNALSLKNYIVDHYREMLAKAESSNENKLLLMREIQDVIVKSRDNSLFIKKDIRNRYLLNDNAYYRDLDAVKNRFWGTCFSKPEKAADFEVPTVEDENQFVTLEQVHHELLGMLKDVRAVFEEEGIPFMLDGGTLISACRKECHSSFLEWDDDVDLSVRSCDAERAINAVRQKLGDKYEVQDYTNEPFYSPRLSRFRVRQKNDYSRIAEKDSEMYELYERQGLFLDIYAYSPILVNRMIDTAYRKCFMVPVYKQIRTAESDWKYGTNPEHAKEKFMRLKKRFMKRADWYVSHAHNDSCFAYEPHYFESLKKMGPYIKKEDMYGKTNTALFENMEFRIPSNPSAVLRAYYGENWEVSPLKKFDDIKTVQRDGSVFYRFSEDQFDASCYKHIKKISIYDTREPAHQE